MADDRQFDGVWRPERDLNGRWIAVRYVQDLDLNNSCSRERDVEYRHGLEVPCWFDTLSQCEPRCDQLNEGGVGRSRT